MKNKNHNIDLKFYDKSQELGNEYRKKDLECLKLEKKIENMSRVLARKKTEREVIREKWTQNEKERDGYITKELDKLFPDE